MKKNIRKISLDRRWQLVFIFLLIILIYFYPILFQRKALFFGDNFSPMVPGKIFTTQWLKQGVLPLWNPHAFSGLPWISDVNQSILYPSTLLFLFFHPSTALSFTVFFHLGLTMWGMYKLAFLWLGLDKKNIKENQHHHLAIISSVVWSLSTQFIGSINNLTTIQSLAWMPWVVYLGVKIFERKVNKFIGNRDMFFFAIVILMQFLGGYPQHVLYSIIATVVFSLFVQNNMFLWLKKWVFLGIVVVGITAVAWLPFVDVLLNSTRMIQTAEQAGVGSLHPILLIKTILPYFFDNLKEGIKWGPIWNGQQNFVFYISWSGITLLVANIFLKTKNKFQKKQKTFFSLLVLLSVVFSLGAFLPGFDLIQKIIPLFRIMRYPSMMLIITNLVLALWMAVAVRQVKITSQVRQKINKFLFILLFFGVAIYFVMYSNFDNFWDFLNKVSNNKLEMSQFHTILRDEVILKNILQNFLANIVFTIISLFFLWRKKLFLFVIILSLDLFLNTRSMLIFAPKNIYEIQEMDFLPQDENDYRFLIRNSNMPYTDFAMYWDATTVRTPFSDSFVDETELRNFAVLQNMKNGYTPNWNWSYGISTPHGYTTLLPQDYAELWGKNESARINSVNFISPNDPLLKSWSTKYYLVDNWFEVAEDMSNFKLLAEEKNWRLYELPETLARFRYEDGSSVDTFQAKVFSQNPNEINLEFDNEQNHSSLVIADRYDANWQAWVNGEKVTTENQNGMRKIPIKNGINKILMKYVPEMFYKGLIVSGLTLLILVGGGVLSSRVYRKKHN